jgi:hypothetical protein
MARITEPTVKSPYDRYAWLKAPTLLDALQTGMPYQPVTPTFNAFADGVIEAVCAGLTAQGCNDTLITKTNVVHNDLYQKYYFCYDIYEYYAGQPCAFGFLYIGYDHAKLVRGRGRGTVTVLIEQADFIDTLVRALVRVRPAAALGQCLFAHASDQKHNTKGRFYWPDREES